MSMSEDLDQRKSNPNDDEDENHYNTHPTGSPEILSGLIQPQTDPQGATAMPPPQLPGQNCGQVSNHSVVGAHNHTFDPNYTFGPYAPNQNQTFGPQFINPNQTFGPQSQNQDLGHNNLTFGPQTQNQNVSHNPNQTFGPHGQSYEYVPAVYKHGDRHGDSCSTCPPSDTSSNITWDNPAVCLEAYTTVEIDDMIENLVGLYNANKEVTDRLRVLKVIEGLMLKNEAMAKFFIREDFCQALDEDIGTRVKISVNSDKNDPDTEECLIYDRKLQTRIKKAAIGQKNEGMVRRIFQKNDRNLSLLARVYGND